MIHIAKNTQENAERQRFLVKSTNEKKRKLLDEL